MGLLAVCGIVLTYSRPTLLALYIALFFMAVVRKDKIMIWVLVAGILLAPFIAPASIKNWAKQVNYNPMRFMCNDDRIAVYQHSLQMIKDRPVLGRGANTFMKNFKNYNNPPHYRDVAVIDYIYAHNIYLHMAGELGLLGLGIFIWFVVVFFKSAKKIYSRLKDDFLKVVLMSLSACLLAFLVNGLTESSLYYARVAMVFWYLAGLTLAMGKINHADKP
jgi:putative inorganic carbon (hco3(-)) transporter